MDMCAGPLAVIECEVPAHFERVSPRFIKEAPGLSSVGSGAPGPAVHLPHTDPLCFVVVAEKY